jgi:hypothetical protein
LTQYQILSLLSFFPFHLSSLTFDKIYWLISLSFFALVF